MATVLLVPASPVGAKKAVAFPDGVWEGTAFMTGSISKQSIFATGSGNVAFTMTVTGGEVTDGTMHYSGSGKSQVPGGSANLSFDATADLSGSAEKILVSGTATWSGTATAMGFTVPVELSTPVGGAFSPTYATCNRVTGDLATETRKVQQSYGFDTNVTAKFVAIRTASGTAVEVVERYTQAVNALQSALEGVQQGTALSVQQVGELVTQIQDLGKAVHDSGPCSGPPPSGFETGANDPVLSDLFNQIMLTLLTDHAGAYSVEELLQLLVLTPQIGMSAEVEDAFDDELSARIPDLVDALGQGVGDDVYTDWPKELKLLHEIYTTAQMLGMDGLAARAKAALANFVQTGGGGEEPVEV